MESVVKLPLDLVQLPQFRQLRELHGFERAVAIWWTLWQELGYRAQVGNCPGRLPGSEMALFLLALEPIFPDKEQRQKCLQDLLTVRLLRQDAEDYVCPRFSVLHGEMNQSRSVAQRGGDMRAFNLRQRKVEAESFQQSLLIPETKLVDGEGKPLPAEDVRRVMRLIVSCDNALFREARPPFGFSEGLIQHALEITRRFNDEQVVAVCRTVATHRHHPALNGMTTEKLLPIFSEIVQKLEGA